MRFRASKGQRKIIIIIKIFTKPIVFTHGMGKA